MLLGGAPEKAMEIETMSPKILPAIVVGSLLATTTLAAAQTRNYQRNYPANPNYYYQQQQMMPMPDVYWQNPYAGTPFYNVAPYSPNQRPDPYWGTVFEGVAPY
jgi:hypothetical protein